VTPSDRPTLPAYLIRTKSGRTILLVAAFGGLLAALPLVLSRKKQEERPASGEAKAASGDPGAPGVEAPPSPSGFGDTLTLGQKYDALIRRYGGDLASTKTELELTRKELDTLRSTLGAERSRDSQDARGLAETVRQLKEGLSKSAGPSPGRELPRGGERGAASGVPGGLRSIELAPPPARERKEKRSVRIPTASGGTGSTLNG